MHLDRVADPLNDSLMCLERVVQDDRGAELAAADDVGLGKAPLDVAALPNPWLAEQRPARHCFVGVEQRL